MLMPQRMSFRTRDPEAATEAVQAALGGGAFTDVGDDLPFAQSATSWGGFVDGRMFVGARAAAHLADGYPAPFLMIVRAGAMSVRQGGPHHDTVALQRSDAMLLTPEVTTRAGLVSPDLDFIQFGPHDLAQAAETAFPHSGRLDFRRSTPRSADARELLTHASQAVRTVLASDELTSRPLLLRSALRHLAVLTLDAFDIGVQAAGGTRSDAVVARAARYIDEHLDEPITVHDIAAAVGVSVRTLQGAFRGIRAETSSRYLQRARLDVVHRALIAADPAKDTVAGIAGQWGFASMGRFAGLYRQAFGAPPSHTLRS